MIQQFPELFPAAIAEGYTLHDIRTSNKMPEVSLRRIKLKARDEQGKARVFTIAPSAVMPYMTGYTDEVEKPLFLRRFGVPFWALTYVFGRNDQYWYRLAGHFGCYDTATWTIDGLYAADPALQRVVSTAGHPLHLHGYQTETMVGGHVGSATAISVTATIWPLSQVSTRRGELHSETSGEGLVGGPHRLRCGGRVQYERRTRGETHRCLSRP